MVTPLDDEKLPYHWNDVRWDGREIAHATPSGLYGVFEKFKQIHDSGLCLGPASWPITVPYVRIEVLVDGKVVDQAVLQRNP